MIPAAVSWKSDASLAQRHCLGENGTYRASPRLGQSGTLPAQLQHLPGWAAYRACPRLGISGTMHYNLSRTAPTVRLDESGTCRASPFIRLSDHPAYRVCSPGGPVCLVNRWNGKGC